MNRAPARQSTSDFDRFLRHCARFWRISPRGYPRGVFKYRTIEEANASYGCDRQSQSTDPVVAAYLKDVDRTLLRNNLRLSTEDRIRKLQDFVRLMISLQASGRMLDR